MTIPAGYFDGLSARRHPVIFSIADGVAFVEGEGVNRREPVGALQISDALGSAPRIVRFADGAFCEVTDHEAFDRLLAESGLTGSAVSQWETSGRWAFAAVVMFVAVLLLTYRFAIPIVATAVAYQVPVTATEALSRRVLEVLDGQFFTPSVLPSDRQQAIAGAFRRLQPPTGSGQADYRIHFRKSPVLGPNALALPSGAIVVTDELVALARDDRELVGVLAHEAGHVDRRHGLRQVLQSSIVGLLVAWYIGDISTIAAAAPTALMEAKYSRDLEREADAYAVEMLRANQIDVTHLANLLERLEARSGAAAGEGALAYLSSHPATSERLERLRSSDRSRR